jgi:hypothetical protein
LTNLRIVWTLEKMLVVAYFTHGLWIIVQDTVISVSSM